MSETKIQTALISVTDKSNLLELAQALDKRGVKILASSGTQKFLGEQGITSVEIAEYTASPELLGGRVKTLHPRIHAGILANRDIPDHMEQLKAKEIAPIDLVIVNLYPFVEKYRDGKLSEKELCEFIDIGGITLIRAAAKNFHHVTVVTNPSTYPMIVDEINKNGSTTLEQRRRLANDAFAVTASYDAAIGSWFGENVGGDAKPDRLNIVLEKRADLRYGENPHQSAAVYGTEERSPILALEQHQGKALSFNNYLDLMGAFAIGRDIGRNGVAILKHTNPCGVGWCKDVLTSYRRALATDGVSAFGGIVAVNGVVDSDLAAELSQLFLEVVVARSFNEEAMQTLSKKKNLRLITIPDDFWEETSTCRFGMLMEGVFLLQDVDAGFPELDDYTIPTKRQPTESELVAMRMAWKVAKHVKSNAIVVADYEGTVGIGAGQMSRVDSSHIATRKARDAGLSLSGSAAASDAFFPFADGVITLAEAGISAVVQPGGSIRDNEVIAAANEANLAMILTGRRHFRHL